MRLTQIDCDWKDNFTGKELRETCKQVGGEEQVYDIKQDSVDSKVCVISSDPLTQDQLVKLWDEGDLWTSYEVWEGDTFESILEQVKAYAEKAQQEEEDAD